MESNFQDVDSLLNNVSKIIQKHKELLVLSGGDYNVFSLLGIGHLENQLHSAFLADLLNPRGHHQQGTIYLELFLREFGIEGDKLFDSKVYREFYIGPVNEDQGGRIDILIKLANQQLIAIENKIYAGEQELQLTRYLNYLKSKSNNYRLLYLTLDGTKSTECNLEEGSYTCVSYRDHITKWLEDCKVYSTNKPRVKEVMNQYIDTIKLLTNQSHSANMNSEIVNKMVASPESITASFEVLANLFSAKNEILTQFQNKIEKKVKESILGGENLTFEFQFVNAWQGNSWGNDKGDFFRVHVEDEHTIELVCWTDHEKKTGLWMRKLNKISFKDHNGKNQQKLLGWKEKMNPELEKLSWGEVNAAIEDNKWWPYVHVQLEDFPRLHTGNVEEWKKIYDSDEYAGQLAGRIAELIGILRGFKFD